MKPENYLDIAEAVLRVARRPLSAKAIMTAAHRGGIVPSHLYGKAQHKTLQARLSEDILHNKLESRFFRTNPGLFFLSDMRSDPAIPDEFKDPFHARRRTRDLRKPSALALEKRFLEEQPLYLSNWKDLLKIASKAGALKHIDPKVSNDDFLFIWAFSVVRRENDVLSYRIGRYRDDRDAFANRRSIGFVEMVSFDDLSLFSDDMGIAECGLNAVMTDLDLSRSTFPRGTTSPSISFFMKITGPQVEPAALFVMEWECPEWFQPTARRLSLNDVRWIDAAHKPNDIDAFEPWSALVFRTLVDIAEQKDLNA